VSEESVKSKKIDRVELLPSSMERLQKWQNQIDQMCPEVMISRKDLVNWALLEHKEVLSDSDLKRIRDTFFDEVQFLRSLLKKAEAARNDGQRLAMPDLVVNTPKPRKKKTQTQKPPPPESNEVT
jgi:hypothetical protein